MQPQKVTYHDEIYFGFCATRQRSQQARASPKVDLLASVMWHHKPMQHTQHKTHELTHLLATMDRLRDCVHRPGSWTNCSRRTRCGGSPVRSGWSASTGSGGAAPPDTTRCAARAAAPSRPDSQPGDQLTKKRHGNLT